MPDIVIRGMEMPDGCHNCRFSYFDKGETNDGEPCTVLMCSAMNQGTNGAEYDGNRPFWCPLVPLPEGHGRLVDADKLAKRLKDFVDWCRDDRRAGAFFVMDCPLPDSPTIVPAEGGTDDDGNA